MKKYKCHKVVWASKIRSIEMNPDGSGESLLHCESERVFVNSRFMDKNQPQEGGYYVKYEDGYESYSPAEAFEKGYCLLSHCMAEEEINNSLFTQKHTKVRASNNNFNAYHDFRVLNDVGHPLAEIHFQEGPIQEHGVNGVFNEDLILMVLTRLQQFQNSPYQCRENAVAITKLEEAAMWLRKRTMDREVRGVEGTHTV